MGNSFALEILGIKLWEKQDPQQISELRRLFGQHGVLVFRRQSLSEHEFADFCSLFGTLERTVRTDWASKVRPEIGLITNLKDFEGKALGGLGDGEVEWHSDQAYMLNPATGSGLYGVEIANTGGTTSSANLCLAYQALPERLKAAIEGKKAIFSYPKRLTQSFKGADQKITEEARRRTPDVIHALVHVNPTNGKKALYLDPTTTIGIVGMPDAQANALLDELAEFAVRPEFVYEHHWQVGDVLLWSNGFLMHRREPFPASERRLMKRSTMILPRDFHIVPEGELAAAV
jgi:taurine dioxygenase